MLPLVIADSFEEYAEGLASYVREKEPSLFDAVYQFTNLDHLITALESDRWKRAIIVVCDTWMDAIKPKIGESSELLQLFVLREEPPVEQEHSNEVYRYQPLDHLLKQICGQATGRGRTIKMSTGHLKHNTMKVISVYSAAGGAGKTTVASNIAYQLQQQRQTVFYLNLEMNSSYQDVKTMDHDHFAQLLYYLKNDPEQAFDKFQNFIITHPEFKWDMLPPPWFFADMQDFKGADLETLSQVFHQSKRYDWLIIDLASDWSELVKSAIACSDMVLWLLLDEIYCLNKTMSLLQQLHELERENYKGWLNKCRFLLNKSLGNSSSSYEMHGIQLSSELPYIPKWKMTEHVEQMISEPQFYRNALQVVSELYGEGGGSHYSSGLSGAETTNFEPVGRKTLA